MSTSEVWVLSDVHGAQTVQFSNSSGEARNHLVNGSLRLCGSRKDYFATGWLVLSYVRISGPCFQGLVFSSSFGVGEGSLNRSLSAVVKNFVRFVISGPIVHWVANLAALDL